MLLFKELKQMFKQKNIVITFLLTILLSLTILFTLTRYVVPSFEEQIMLNITDNAKRVSNHLIEMYNEKKDFNYMEKVRKDFNLEKIKFFGQDGTVIYSSNKKDIGSKNKYDYFYNKVVKGEIFYVIVKKGKKTLEGREVQADVAEVYIPIMENGKFQYAFEVYYDITQNIERFNLLKAKIQITSYFMVFILVLFVLIGQYYLYRSSEKEKLLKEKLNNSKKLADMGEMIGNIAHQWRQPLSIISTSATGMLLQKRVGNLNDKECEKYCHLINDNAQYLSNTIDDFRNFIKEDKVLKDISIQQEVKKAKNIISTTLNNMHIELIDNIDYTKETKITMGKNELSQVLINILNNSKDILIEKKIQKPWVKIDIIHKKVNLILITVEDNGGGISKKALPRVFEPYFTTKHQSQGTGLGLHMSYQIIKSLRGKLWVENSEHGAKFFIELPCLLGVKE